MAEQRAAERQVLYSLVVGGIALLFKPRQKLVPAGLSEGIGYVES